MFSQFPDAPIIGLEPSELLSLEDEAADLLDHDMQQKLKLIRQRSYLFEEFVDEKSYNNLNLSHSLDIENHNFLIHVHCHQKSLVGTASAYNVIAKLPGAKAKILDAGCCGMAGSFGYKYLDLSKKIANLQFIPAIKSAQSSMSTVVASGFSCRSQMFREIGIKALHPAEVIAEYLN